MQRTICDRCGTECKQYRARLYGGITHETNKGEQVAEDEIRPFDLCSHCMDALVKEFGVRFGIYSMTKDSYELMEAVPVAPVRFNSDHPVVADRIREAAGEPG